MNPVRQKAYKVVYRNSKGELTSAVRNVRQSKHTKTVYKPKGITRAKVGPLFLFRHLPQAKRFNVGGDRREIWEVEAYGAKPLPFRANWETLRWLSSLTKFWQLTHYAQRLDGYSSPVGTIGARCLRMKRRVA